MEKRLSAALAIPRPAQRRRIFALWRRARGLIRTSKTIGPPGAPDCVDAALPCLLSHGCRHLLHPRSVWPHRRLVVPCRGYQTISVFLAVSRDGCRDLVLGQSTFGRCLTVCPETFP